MYRGHYAKGKAHPHQALAEAIFTTDFQHTLTALRRLNMLGSESHMTAALFVAALEGHDENAEDVARALRDAETADERNAICEWIMGPPSGAKLSELCQSLRKDETSWAVPAAPMSKPGDTPMATPLRDMTPSVESTPLDPSLQHLLQDFLAMSSTEVSESVGGTAADDAEDDMSEAPEDPAALLERLGADIDPPPPTTAPSAPGRKSTSAATAAAQENAIPGDEWYPSSLPVDNDDNHEAFYVLFFRVAGARALAKRLGHVKSNNLRDRVLLRKLQRYILAHENCVRWALLHPDRVTMDELQLVYGEGCGPGNVYAPDRALIRTTRHEHVMRERPLEMLERLYPQAHWRPEHVPRTELAKLGRIPRLVQPQVSDATGEVSYVGWAPFAEGVTLDTHTLYYGVVYVLNQCLRYLRCAPGLGQDVSYSLWVYYCSWTDLFAHCLTVGRIDDAYLRLPPGSYTGRDGRPVYGDGAAPWTLYGTCDARTFCAGDLPDLYHVLVTIPLWGEQRTPPYFLGKLYQKAMPFAGQRRHIVKLAVKCALEHPPFWKLFSRLVWVMLANLYPGELAGPYDRLGMRSLLRAKELCENRDMLIGVLMAQQPGMTKLLAKIEAQGTQDPFLRQVIEEAKTGGKRAGSNGGPLIVRTLFRLHILYMGSFNDAYVERARALIDWDYHKADAVRLANVVRSHSLFAHDAFAQARVDLSRTVKSPNSHVHRIRRRSVSVMLREKMDETLEKVILVNRHMYLKDAVSLKEMLKRPDVVDGEAFLKQTKSGERAARDGVQPEHVTLEILQMALQCAEEAVAFYDRELNLQVKSAILNALLYVEPADRLTRTAFAGLLMRPECGGITARAVELMWHLVLVARGKAAPREFALIIAAMEAHDFLVATYYFNAVTLLEKIHFAPLDADTIQKTEETMCRVRYGNDDSTDAMYEVCISLCCDRICTMMGQDRYGNRKVSYDLEKRQLVCAHNVSTAVTSAAAAPGNDDDDDDDDDDCHHHHHDDNDEDDDDDDDEDDDNVEDEEHAVLRQVDHEAEQEEEDRESIRGLGDDMMLLGELGGGASGSGRSSRGAKRTRVMQDRKIPRNQRKAFSKVPCGQPVLVVSLRGRALLWGNQLDKRIQVMFCPQCGALHMYTIFGWSALENPLLPAPYRCAECMRRELTHIQQRSCAYCGRPAHEEAALQVTCLVRDTTYNGDPTFDPLSPAGRAQIVQSLHFCETHHRIVRRLPSTLSKNEVWRAIKAVQEARARRRASGAHTPLVPTKWK